MYIVEQKTGLDFTMTWDRMRAVNSFFYSNLEKQDIKAIGVQYEGLIVDCTYQGKDCSKVDFKSYLHPSLINCYTFQANNSVNKNILVGPHNGLSLILRSEGNVNFFYETMDKLQNVDSIKLAVHAPGTIPSMTNKGINLKPGESTSISLMMKTYERLGSPYTECQDKGIFELDSKTYVSTTDACREKCIVSTIQKQCNCTSTLFEDVTKSDLPYCLEIQNNSTYIEFHERLMCEIGIQQGDGDLNCNECLWDCNEIDYDTQIAFSTWPLESKINHFIIYHVIKHIRRNRLLERPCHDPIRAYYAFLLKKNNIICPVSICPTICPDIHLEMDDGKLPFSSMNLTNVIKSGFELFAYARPDFTEAFKYVMDVPKSYHNLRTKEELDAKWVKNSFYRVNIYFRQSAVEQHSQVASMSLADFWSSVGGILGLWLGISIMTIIEVLSCILKLFYKCCFVQPQP